MKYNFMPVVFFLNNARYKYVSKLTIKLLEEGFDLQEHFLALRRYHFMELADWADLFIMSLWNHVFLSNNSSTLLFQLLDHESVVPFDLIYLTLIHRDGMLQRQTRDYQKFKGSLNCLSRGLHVKETLKRISYLCT